MPGTDLDPLLEAIETLPFLGERTLIELRDFDINKCRDKSAETLKTLEIPEYCTVAIILKQGYEPDGRLSAVKTVRKLGQALEFTPQAQSELIRWISRRFEALGKTIGRAESEHLIFLSGGLMNRLIQDIEKLSAYADGSAITRADMDAVVSRLPEAEVFEMSDKLAAGDYNGTIATLYELLEMREHPIRLLSVIGQQFRNLYAARLALDYSRDTRWLMDVSAIRYDFIARRLLGTARGFSSEQLADILDYCAESDYLMKSKSADDADILIDLLLRISLRRGSGKSR